MLLWKLYIQIYLQDSLMKTEGVNPPDFILIVSLNQQVNFFWYSLCLILDFLFAKTFFPSTLCPSWTVPQFSIVAEIVLSYEPLRNLGFAPCSSFVPFFFLLSNGSNPAKDICFINFYGRTSTFAELPVKLSIVELQLVEVHIK